MRRPMDQDLTSQYRTRNVADRTHTHGCFANQEFVNRQGNRLKQRVLQSIFPVLAQGFLKGSKRRVGQRKSWTEEQLKEVFDATLRLLYRLLFLLYAESRDLLLIQEAPVGSPSFRAIRDEITDNAGPVASECAGRIKQTYSVKSTRLHASLRSFLTALDMGESILNAPSCSSDFFRTTSDRSERRGKRIVRFLDDTRIPDRFLARAIDLLAREQDEITLDLVLVDFRSLEVRLLGAIYEELLDFRLKLSHEDLTLVSEKQDRTYIPLCPSRPGSRRKGAAVDVQKNDIYLVKDKTRRKATGSYYTPDPIVEYIVAQTVGPVIDQKLVTLGREFYGVQKTFANALRMSRRCPSRDIESGKMDHRQWAEAQCYNVHKELVEQLFDLRILDPAMGSGHFLIKVANYVTDRLLTFLKTFSIHPVSCTLEKTRQSILKSLAAQGITIDQEKLTDFNLLKRLVLQRCIYGVDLNPMAVQIAKMSVWLDASALGEPLSFLDQQLRCGNSLIGASFQELEERAFPRFGPPYTLALPVTQHTVGTPATDDAAAAEFFTPGFRPDQVRRALNGYRATLDLLVARHFGLPQSRDLVQVEKRSKRSRFKTHVASLGDENKRHFAADVAALSNRPDCRFFHWEIEFPEVFFDRLDIPAGTLQHKNQIKNGSAGFDCVVGNPPYVRMEMFKSLKPRLKEAYRCHAERADLLIYFHERALALLKQGGHYAFICSSNWSKTTAGKNLRQLLTSNATIKSIVDLSEANIFEHASTYPWILVAQKGQPPSNAALSANMVFDRFTSSADIERTSFQIPLNALNADPWKLSRTPSSQLLNRLLGMGPCLKEVFGSPVYGIKTGLNSAFVVDGATRDAFVESDPKCATLLKPFLEGRDIRPWKIAPRNLWLIYSTRGTDLASYPALLRHFRKFGTALRQRAATQQWYELQQAQVNYAEIYRAPKLVFPRFANRPCFALDPHGTFIGNAISTIPSNNPVLLFYLMSPVTWFILRALGAPMANGYRQLHGHVVERLPIPTFSRAAEEEIKTWMQRALSQGVTSDAPWHLVYDAFRISAEEQRIVLEHHQK